MRLNTIKSADGARTVPKRLRNDQREKRAWRKARGQTEHDTGGKSRNHDGAH